VSSSHYDGLAIVVIFVSALFVGLAALTLAGS